MIVEARRLCGAIASATSTVTFTLTLTHTLRCSLPLVYVDQNKHYIVFCKDYRSWWTSTALHGVSYTWKLKFYNELSRNLRFLHIECALLYLSCFGRSRFCPDPSRSLHHRNWKVLRMTTLIFTGDVEGKLQRLQWIQRLSIWRPFHFCDWLLTSIGLLRCQWNNPEKHGLNIKTERSSCLTNSSSLSAPEIAMVTTPDGAGDENIINVRIFPFQCIIYIYIYIYNSFYSIRVPGWVLKCLNLITAPGSVSNQPGSVTWLATAGI